MSTVLVIGADGDAADLDVGAIAVGVDVHAGQADRGLETWVEDEGPGIPDEEKERVFTKFYRGSSSGILPGGTGLGLTIASEIARVHGGTIRVEDVSPKGTRFLVLLPAEHTRETED